MAAHSLVFQSFRFDAIDRNNQPWLKLPQIAECLYRKGGDQSDPPFDKDGDQSDSFFHNQIRQVYKLYQRHADEFTDAMTALVELETNGGKQKVRIFSLRGCHLLAMFARTKVAKEFRKWVLDILDRETQPTIQADNFISAFQSGELATLIKERFPDGADRAYAWSRFNKHFRIARYRELPAERFDEACEYIPQMPGKNEVRALPAPMPVIKPPVCTRPIPDCLLPPEQAKEIDERIDRLCRLFNPLGSQFADVHGIWRALRGMHPKLGTVEAGYRKVIKDN